MNALKLSLIVLLAFSSSQAFGQLSKLVGTWISDNDDALEISSDTTGKDSKISNFRTWDLRCDASMRGNQLSFKYEYYNILPGDMSRHFDNYDFIIISQTDSEMILEPYSTFSKTFFGHRPSIRFLRQDFAVDTSIHFVEILFHIHNSNCIGRCSIYHLAIDSNRDAALFAERVFINPLTRDETKEGYFFGHLGNRTYDSLIHAIQSCNLKSMVLSDFDKSDTSARKIIIYFNDQRLYLQPRIPHAILDRLFDLLVDICEENTFSRTNESFALEE